MKHKLNNLVVCEGDLPEGITFPNGMAAVDAEMMGLNLRRDRLCLVQVGDGDGNVWLVRFAPGSYNAPRLKALLEDPKTLKIMHYGRMDMAFFKHYLEADTTAVYDTKIASKLCRTYTDRHGLKNLVEEVLGIRMDKEQQSSWWGAPELSEEQKHYAASDVLYLHALKENLDRRLQSVNRTWLAQQCFDFLPVRVALDLEGWENNDIFAHS